jgi:hypothetical protein
MHRLRNAFSDQSKKWQAVIKAVIPPVQRDNAVSAHRVACVACLRGLLMPAVRCILHLPCWALHVARGILHLSVARQPRGILAAACCMLHLRIAVVAGDRVDG